MEALDDEKRATLSLTLRERRAELGWNQEQLAERAEIALRNLLADSGFRCSTRERRAWIDLELSRHHVATLEGHPARPLLDVRRRGRLLGISTALGLDRALINRLSGGL